MIRRFGIALVCALFVLPAIGSAEESNFDSNGVKIHYRVEGEGEPVLLIHGFAANASFQWGASGIIKALAKDHRVIAVDVRGHGKSGKPTEVKQYGTEMVEDVVRLLDHLKIKKAHVVGYSMGALIAGKLMALHPDRLLSATLGGAVPLPEGVKLPPFVADLADSLEKGKGIAPLISALMPAGTPKLSDNAMEQLNRQLVGDNGKALAAVVRSWKTLAVTKEQLKANKVPTLILMGESDPLKQGIEVIKDDLANVKVVTIDGVGHMTAFASPKFLAELKKFLEEHKADSRLQPARKAG
ncbi:MAG: alpha/beta fold hydrolase [Gemmataceae bacterium]